MNTPPTSVTIGALAERAGVNVETIRFYQRKRLMPEPKRPQGGIRRYGEAELARLNFIRAAQSLGFSLDQVAELLKLEDGTHCGEAQRLAEVRLRDVRERLAHLRRIESALSTLVARCSSAGGSVKCPLISSLRGP